MQRECGRLIRQSGAKKADTPFFWKEYAGRWFPRVFQGVSTVEAVFCFHQAWWEMHAWDKRNGISLVHLSRKAARVAVLSCEAHVDNRILDIQREKDLMEVSWLFEVCWSFSFVSSMFSFLFDATWILGAFARRAGWCSAPTGNRAGSVIVVSVHLMQLFSPFNKDRCCRSG